MESIRKNVEASRCGWIMRECGGYGSITVAARSIQQK